MGKRNELPFSDIEETGVALLSENMLKQAEGDGYLVILLDQVGELDPLVKMLVDQSGMDYKQLQKSYKAFCIKFKNGIV